MTPRGSKITNSETILSATYYASSSEESLSIFCTLLLLLMQSKFQEEGFLPSEGNSPSFLESISSSKETVLLMFRSGTSESYPMTARPLVNSARGCLSEYCLLTTRSSTIFSEVNTSSSDFQPW